MRTKIILALFILLLTSAFIFEHSAEYYQPPPVPAGHSIADSFLIGAMDIGYESSRSVYNSLGFNVWHKYNIGADTQNGAFQIYGWTNLISNDVLTEPVGNYANAVLGIYNGNWSNNPRMWTIAERPKITRLCFGQRSDYQCETVTPYSCDKWYYSFQDHSAGTDVTDSCQTVRYCQRNENQTDGGADWVVRKLKCNNEQCYLPADLPVPPCVRRTMGTFTLPPLM